MTQPWTFDAFQPGLAIGADVQVADLPLIERWHAIYGGSPDAGVPFGVIPVLAARAYMAVTAPRPSGNIHAGQSFRLVRPPQRNERLLVTVECKAKSLRGQRRIVAFDLAGTSEANDEPLFDGVMTVFWAR